MIAVLFQSMLIGYSGAMMPGTLLVYTIDKSMKSGTKAGLLISIGHALVELLVVILLFLGLGTFLSTNTVQMVIGLIGGLVLLGIGFSMLWDTYKGRLSIEMKETDQNYGNLLLGGGVISVSNPYFTVWWVAVGLGLMMNAYSLLGIKGVIVFYLGHILADITWYVFLSILISKTKKFINLRVYKIIIVFLGICVIGFGVQFLILAVSEISSVSSQLLC